MESRYRFITQNSSPNFLHNIWNLTLPFELRCRYLSCTGSDMYEKIVGWGSFWPTILMEWRVCQATSTWQFHKQNDSPHLCLVLMKNWISSYVNNCLPSKSPTHHLIGRMSHSSIFSLTARKRCHFLLFVLLHVIRFPPTKCNSLDIPKKCNSLEVVFHLLCPLYKL